MADIAAETVSNCSYFRPYHEREYVFFAVNVVVVSILCGLGLLGNVLNLLVLHQRLYVRQSQAIVYVFLAGLALADIVVLALRSPTALSAADVLPHHVNYSVFLAYFHVVQYGLYNIFKHAATWMVVSAGVMYYLTMGRTFRRKDAWVRRNRGRVIIVFVFLFVTMLDMPRFFERKVMTLHAEECFDNVTVFFWVDSDFSKHAWYRRFYPWITVSANYILPLLLIILFIMLIIMRTTSASYRRRLKERRKRRRKPRQATQMLVALLVVYLALELPACIAHLLWALNMPSINSMINHNQFILIAETMSLIHSSITFIVYSAISTDFRKTLGNVCCCLCIRYRKKHRGSARITRTGSSATMSTSRKSSLSSVSRGSDGGTLPRANGTIPRANGTLLTSIEDNETLTANGYVANGGFTANGALPQIERTDLSAANKGPMWI